MQLGKALHMGFVEDRLRPRDHRGRVALPVIVLGIDHAALRHDRSAVFLVEAEVLFLRLHVISKMGARPCDIADEFAGIGVDEQLVGVEAMAVFRVERAVDAVAVERAGLQAWNIAVPDFVGEFGKLDTGGFGLPAFIEEAEFNALCMGGKQREIHSVLIRRGAKRRPRAGFHACLPCHVGHRDPLCRTDQKVCSAGKVPLADRNNGKEVAAAPCAAAV